MTVDELLKRHPTPWNTILGGTCIADKEGGQPVPIVGSHRSAAICEIINDYARMRNEVDFAHARTDHNGEVDANIIAALREENTQLHATLDGVAGRLADAFYTHERRHEINNHDAGANDCVSSICDALRGGFYDAAIKGTK